MTKPHRMLTYVLAIIVTIPTYARAANEITLHSFGDQQHGAYPYTLVRDARGNLYGTTGTGGMAGWGVVFKLDTAGNQTVLHSFTGGADGGSPTGGVIPDAAGNLYGTTYNGGASQLGVVYKLDPTGNETVLHTFTGGADGGYPESGVVLDPDGNLYGATTAGGTGYGVVFMLSTAGNETVLHNFAGAPDGREPWGNLIRDLDGNLYGTTVGGGTLNEGTVFKVDATGGEAVLYSFPGGAGGASPDTGVVRDSEGNLYGTTEGEAIPYPAVVFKLDPGGNATVLCNLSGTLYQHYSGLTLDPQGNLYGTTFNGGSGSAGVVYKLDPAGSQTVLYNFTYGTDGANPFSGVVRDAEGNLYGTTGSGGTGNLGVVFRLDPSGQERVLYNFWGSANGDAPVAVIRGQDGNLYGTTMNGGVNGLGVIFKLDATAHETVLYNFTGNHVGYVAPSGLIRESDGNIYGTSAYGGEYAAGEVFKLDAAGQATVLYTFTDGADGGIPAAGVIRDAAGNLYGTASDGGTGGYGVVFMLDPAGRETVLYNFAPGTTYFRPDAGLIRDEAGNLYGTASAGAGDGGGLVFKLDAAGNYTVLRNLEGTPTSGVIRDAEGNLYGTTGSAITYGPAEVYKLDPAGNITVLHRFPQNQTGTSGVVRDAAGNLYGAIMTGGTFNQGMVYKLDPQGQLTVLYSFTGGDDGSGPGKIILGEDGNLYGVTIYYSGKKGGGVVFAIKL